jgi:hypothetical protein
VHIGVLSLRLVLQSFRPLRNPGKKRAVTVNTVYPLSQLSLTFLVRKNRAIASAGLCKGSYCVVQGSIGAWGIFRACQALELPRQEREGQAPLRHSRHPWIAPRSQYCRHEQI